MTDNTQSASHQPPSVEQEMAARGWELADFDAIAVELERLSALARIYAFHTIAHDRSLVVDGDATIRDANATVRAATLAEVRERIKGMPVRTVAWTSTEFEDVLGCRDILAALAALETP